MYWKGGIVTRLQSNKNSVFASFNNSLYSSKTNSDTVEPPITRTRVTRTPRSLTQTKSNFPWISPHFLVIFTQSTQTRKTRIPRHFELKFLSLDQKTTATW